MINNLQEYFEPEQEIFLESVSYKRIEDLNSRAEEVTLLCQDNVKATVKENDVRIVITRSLLFDPEKMFHLSVSFGADLKFNDRKSEHDWTDINLAEEFRQNGEFVTDQLMSRISLLIGQITSSFGQKPFVLPPKLAKKDVK